MNLHLNSATFWFPKIYAAGLPVPKTVFIPYDYKKILPIFDGLDCAEYDRLWHEVKAAAEKMGLPCFLRSDVTSAKHQGPKAYKIENIDNLNDQLGGTLEETELKTFMHYQKPKALMVREWLNLDSSFTAFNGLAISREWRVFADSLHVLCAHPYWPEEAIKGHTTDPDWKKKLNELQAISPPTLISMGEKAIAAAQAVGGGTWSVDYAQDISEKWWLTDMALAEDSYHWSGCKNNPENNA
jgi:hypothetical protein